MTKVLFPHHLVLKASQSLSFILPLMSSSEPNSGDEAFTDSRAPPVFRPDPGVESWNNDEGWKICFPEDESEASAPASRSGIVSRLVTFFSSPNGRCD